VSTDVTLGGLVVIVLVIGPRRFMGSNPAKDNAFLK
jgi:hypothetical protein